jgi:hypothetical protein
MAIDLTDLDIKKIPGPKGEPGRDGVDGKDGKDGVDGKDGKDGAKGDKGDPGIDGLNGLDGVDGKDGKNGKHGRNGIDGKDGLKGDKGDQGPRGFDGERGLKGEKGEKGEPGEPAQSGKGSGGILTFGRRGVPRGGTDGQVLTKVGGQDYSTAWGSAGGGGAWGDITGTLSDQTDLQAALDAKADDLGADDNYVTDAEKVKLSNLSGTNTGDNAVNTLYSGLAASKQNTLVSGTNIKTINGDSILGSGDLTVMGGSGISEALAIAYAVAL